MKDVAQMMLETSEAGMLELSIFSEQEVSCNHAFAITHKLLRELKTS